MAQMRRRTPTARIRRRDQDRRRFRARSRRTTRSRAAAPKLSSKWDCIGPDTLNVDRLGTQSFIKPTQWSGRVTALDRRPEVQAAGVHPLRRRGRRRRLADEERARAEPVVEADLGRDPDERDRLDRRRSERRDRQDDLRRHRRGERQRRQRGRARPLQDDRRWRALVARAGSFAVANNRSIAWVAIEPGEPEPHPDRHPLRHRTAIGSNATRRHRRSAVARRRRLRLDRRRRDASRSRRPGRSTRSSSTRAIRTSSTPRRHRSA